MVGCSVCGQPLKNPRECSYCDRVFCAEHRLPERHDCAGVRNWERRGRRFDSGFGGYSTDDT